jgi:hypothetical protein
MWCKFERCECNNEEKKKNIHPTVIEMKKIVGKEDEAAKQEAIWRQKEYERATKYAEIKAVEKNKRLELWKTKDIIPKENYKVNHIDDGSQFCDDCDRLRDNGHKHFWDDNHPCRVFECDYPYIKGMIIDDKFHLVENDDDYYNLHRHIRRHDDDYTDPFANVCGQFYCENCYFKEGYGDEPCDCEEIQDAVGRIERAELYNDLSDNGHIFDEYINEEALIDPFADEKFLKMTEYFSGEIKICISNQYNEAKINGKICMKYKSKQNQNECPTNMTGVTFDFFETVKDCYECKTVMTIKACDPNRREESEYDNYRKTYKYKEVPEERGIQFTGKYFCRECLGEAHDYGINPCEHVKQ